MYFLGYILPWQRNCLSLRPSFGLWLQHRLSNATREAHFDRSLTTKKSTANFHLPIDLMALLTWDMCRPALKSTTCPLSFRKFFSKHRRGAKHRKSLSKRLNSFKTSWKNSELVCRSSVKSTFQWTWPNYQQISTCSKLYRYNSSTTTKCGIFIQLWHILGFAVLPGLNDIQALKTELQSPAQLWRKPRGPLSSTAGLFTLTQILKCREWLVC